MIDKNGKIKKITPFKYIFGNKNIVKILSIFLDKRVQTIRSINLISKLNNKTIHSNLDILISFKIIKKSINNYILNDKEERVKAIINMMNLINPDRKKMLLEEPLFYL